MHPDDGVEAHPKLDQAVMNGEELQAIIVPILPFAVRRPNARCRLYATSPLVTASCLASNELQGHA